MGDSTKHGVRRKEEEEKKKAAREATRGAGGRTDGLRRSLAPPVGFLPLPVRSAPTLPPENSDAAPQHPNVTFSRLLECAGLFLTLLSTSSLSLHAAGCSLEWHFTSESLSHAGSPSPSGKSDLFFDRCLSVATPPLIAKPSREKRSPGKHSVVLVRNPTTAL